MKSYGEKMPNFNQLCLIVSYLENIQIEPDENCSTLWLNKCDEMMTDGEFSKDCNPFACAFAKADGNRFTFRFFRASFVLALTNICSSISVAHRLIREDAHYAARLAKGPGHVARYIGLIGVLETAMLVAETYVSEGGLFSAPEDQFNRAISLIFDRQAYKGIRQGQDRLIVSEAVVTCALHTVELNQLIYRRLFAIDSKILVSRISANHDQTPEAKDLLKIGAYFLEHPSVLFSLSDVVEANSYLRRKNTYSKVSTVLQILESKELLRKFTTGIHGLRDITLYVKLLPRNRDSVIQLLDFEVGVAIQIETYLLFI